MLPGFGDLACRRKNSYGCYARRKSRLIRDAVIKKCRCHRQLPVDTLFPRKNGLDIFLQESFGGQARQASYQNTVELYIWNGVSLLGMMYPRIAGLGVIFPS